MLHRSLLVVLFTLSLFLPSLAPAEEVDVLVTWDPDFREIENGSPIKDWADHPLCLGNEVTVEDDRTWLGSIYSVAIYDRMLRGDEIQKNFDAGYDGNNRVTSDLIAYYNFKTNAGNTVFDQTDNPINLTISPPANVTWINSGGISINSSARILSAGPASKINNAVIASNEITIEAWIKPTNLTQSGPARIVSLSQDSGIRNITLGQTADAYVVRCLTTTSSVNGTPSLDAPGTVTTTLTHVVYALDSRGAATIYVNSEPKASQHTIPTTYTGQDEDGNPKEYTYVYWEQLRFFDRAENGSYDYENPIGTLPQVYDANGYSNPKTKDLKVNYEDGVVSTRYYVVRSYYGEGEDEIHSEDSDEVSLERDLTEPPPNVLSPPRDIFISQ